MQIHYVCTNFSASRLSNVSSSSNRSDLSRTFIFVAQLCNERESARIVGIAIDTTGDLSAVRKLIPCLATRLYPIHIFIFH